MGRSPQVWTAALASGALALAVLSGPGSPSETTPADVPILRAAAAPTGPAAHVVAVGDIASASGLDDAVADRVAALAPDALLLLGDIAYSSGSAQEFSSYFAPEWSRFSAIWTPVPGNHEYRTTGVAGYREFFGVPSGPLYSSTKVGAWRIIGLDSETPASSGQLAWLEATLAAHDGEPTLVMWHRPRFSSGQHGDQRDTDGLWDAVKDDPDVHLVLWGHDHDYERMSVPVAGRDALTAMVVGTGGGELRATPTLPARSWREFYVDHTTGVLDLQLGAAGFSWRFVTADGTTLDQGSELLAGPQASVRVRAVQGRSKLRVNVDPNQGARYWKFRVQRQRADGTWVAKKTYRTRKSGEVRTVNLRRGTYRVWVKPKFGHEGTMSAEATLTR